jgi:hypothetical protein
MGYDTYLGAQGGLEQDESEAWGCSSSTGGSPLLPRFWGR